MWTRRWTWAYRAVIGFVGVSMVLYGVRAATRDEVLGAIARLVIGAALVGAASSSRIARTIERRAQEADERLTRERRP
jgi:hypothetical protein